MPVLIECFCKKKLLSLYSGRLGAGAFVWAVAWPEWLGRELAWAMRRRPARRGFGLAWAARRFGLGGLAASWAGRRSGLGGGLVYDVSHTR
jgi:hypothetical protein